VQPDRVPIEREVQNIIKSKTKSDLQRELAAFEKFIAEQTAMLETLVFEVTGEIGRAMTVGLYRALLHVAIYRRNSSWSVENYKSLALTILKNTEKQSFSGRVIFNESGQQPWSISMSLHDPISKALKVARAFNIELPNHRKKAGRLKQGYDNSHLLPFVENGEGKTFAEAAPLNRARGAKPIE
jgi:hypothetical protein